MNNFGIKKVISNSMFTYYNYFNSSFNLRTTKNYTFLISFINDEQIKLLSFYNGKIKFWKLNSDKDIHIELFNKHYKFNLVI